MTFEEYPFYVDVQGAMEITGLSKQTIEDALHACDPLPHFKVGRYYKINKFRLLDFFQRLETGSIR